MKAAICTRYGPPSVVKVRDVPKPTPASNEALIRVCATCVNSGDRRIRSLDVPAGMGLMVRAMFGVLRPRQPVLGSDVAGVVEAVGDAVSSLRVGDEVIASMGVSLGAHAEYVTMPVDEAVLPKPKRLSMEESAALIFGGLTAIHFLTHEARLESDNRILINGATGAIGCASVQLAKHFGAHVTAVCSSDGAELATSLGADRVIDYRMEPVLSGNSFYDAIMDNVGNLTWSVSRRHLTDNGRLISVATGLPEMLLAPIVSAKEGKRLIVGVAKDDRPRLAELIALIDAGAIKPVIDQVMSFEEIVAAHARADSGRKQGALVLSF